MQILHYFVWGTLHPQIFVSAGILEPVLQLYLRNNSIAILGISHPWFFVLFKILSQYNFTDKI